MESDFVLPCNNSPVSASIPQSYGKKGDEYSNCSTSCTFWGMPTTGASVLNVQIFLLLFLRKSLLYMHRHNNIIIQVLRLVLFSSNLLGLQNQWAASKVKEFSTLLCVGRCNSHLTEIISFVTHLTTWDQHPVFSFLSFLRDHSGEWLQADCCWKAGIVFFPEFPQSSP